MSSSTSENIAKALKGAELSAKQRIVKAVEAWENDSIFFPNKDDFLLEWICSAFAKPNMKKLDDCCLLQLPYWTLLLELLEHYQKRALLDPKRSPPTIQVNLVLSVSTVLHQLVEKKNVQPKQYFNVCRRCLEILFSDSFSLSYRPAFEHVSTAVDQILLSLKLEIEQCRENESNSDLNELASLSRVLLEKFDSQLILAANQKKIFTSIVEKLFPRLASVRRRINLTNDCANISQIITSIICHALFHADTILEFTSVLKDVSIDQKILAKTKQTNYVEKLFETLSCMVDNKDDKEQVLDALDIFPVLFSAFLEAFRQKRNTSTSALQDISRMAEFGMFVYLTNITEHVETTFVSAYLETICKLLQEVLEWNVYSARNDDIAKSQQEVLNRFSNDMVLFINSPEEYDQDLVLKFADILLQIDFSLIESQIYSLWPVMLNPVQSAQNGCLKLVKSILNTYAASRQLDLFVQDLIKQVELLQSKDLFLTLEKPMFTKGFLNEFSGLISKSMPVAQSLGIFKLFQESLTRNAVKSTTTHVDKKQKKNTEPNTIVAALITMYFVEFVQSLKLNQHQLSTFKESTTSIYTDFVKPGIQSSDKNGIVVLPAIQIHAALASAFFDSYFSILSENDRTWLADSYKQLFKVNKHGETLLSRHVIVTCVNAMLQHAYYISLLQSTSQSQTTEMVNIIVDYVTSTKSTDTWYMNSKWNGSALGLDSNETVKLACWKLLSDEWFESVSRYIDISRAEKMASIVYSSLTLEIPSTEFISAQLLNTALLRSANFYETQCFKDCNIKTILGAMVRLFASKSFSTSGSNDSQDVCCKLISSMDISKTITVTQEAVNLLSTTLNKNTDLMELDINANSTENVTIISNYMKLFLLFPIEYYEKNERGHISYLATLIDIWAVSCASAEPTIRTRVSLLSRSLQLRFMDYFSYNSLLGMDSTIMEWLLSSIDVLPSEGNMDIQSLEHVTNELDLSILRKVTANVGIKNSDAHSTTFFSNTLDRRIGSIKHGAIDNQMGKVINIIKSINSVLSSRKSSEFDANNVIYAAKHMENLSNHVIFCLENAKDFIKDLLKSIETNNSGKKDLILQNKKEFERIKLVFYLTRLLQDHGRIVGPKVDEVIHAEKISSTLTTLASPFIEFLQCALLVPDHRAVLDMTIEYIASFCSILSRYQKVETTKRVLAAIWFVYSLVLDTGDQEAIQTLSVAFGAWMQSLSKDQYIILIEGFTEQAEAEANTRDADKDHHHLVFLSLLSLLFKNCNDDEKGRLKKHIPLFVLKISLIAGRTHSLEYLQKTIKFLVQLTGEQSYHFNGYDASLVLSCLLQVAHPTASERFKDQMTRNMAHGIFDDVCSVLSNMVSQHKDQIVYMLPPFIALVQSLLHCFKATHVSLVGGTNSHFKKRKLNSEQKTKEINNKSFSGRSIPLFLDFTPLNDSSAQRFARLLTTIPQKQHSTLNSNTKSTQTLQKIISKHTPSILIEYFNIQSNVSMSVVQPSTKSILTQALYDILDICSETDRTFILSCLDGPGKTLFKSFYTNWKDNHKYTGQ